MIAKADHVGSFPLEGNCEFTRDYFFMSGNVILKPAKSYAEATSSNGKPFQMIGNCVQVSTHSDKNFDDLVGWSVKDIVN